MAFQIIVPEEGGFENCYLAHWRKQAGDRVFLGDLLCEVETGKAVVDIMAPADGYLLATLYAEGEEVPTLAPIAWIGEKDEKIGSIVQAKAKTERIQDERQIVIHRDFRPGIPDKPIASPRAKKFAQDHGLALEGIAGTGLAGSIVERDVRARFNETRVQVIF